VAIAFVSRKQGGNAGISTTVSTGAQSHTAGNLLVLLVQWQTVAVPTIANTAGDTWTVAGSTLSSSVNRCGIWYAKNCVGNASDDVTATFPIQTTYRTATVFEFSGCDLTAPLDAAPNGSTGNSTAISSSSVTVSASEDVICMFCEADADTISNATYNITNFAVTGDATKYFADGYHIVTASEAASATCASGVWYIKAASFKVANATSSWPGYYGTPQGWF
jgi:hypothetical protein